MSTARRRTHGREDSPVEAFAKAVASGKKLIPTIEAAKILNVSMARVRQLASQGPKSGGLHSWSPSRTSRFFDEAEVRRFKNRDRGTGGRPGKFTQN